MRAFFDRGAAPAIERELRAQFELFLGFGLLSFGVLWVYNVKPRIRKKPHPRPAPAEVRS